jgi:DNA segregation ATPase FtsK/SpoIIIE-like protein
MKSWRYLPRLKDSQYLISGRNIDQEVKMMRRRMVGRSVARVAVGTAVVAGTAGAVSHHQQQKYAQQDAAAQQQYDQAYQQGAADAQAQQPQQYAPPPVEYAPPPAQAPEVDVTAKLQQLAELHSSGVLTDEEFAAAKQKLLAS